MVTGQLEDNHEKNAENTTNQTKIPNNVYIIAQEIQIVRSLTTPDGTERNRQLKKLRKWLQIRSNSSFPFCEEDFLRLWKGLYFCMWMCDKPLNQEDLADEIGKTLKCFNKIETSIQFFGAFLKTLCHEWFGIDQWRMDKFMMLIRRIFRAIFQLLKDNRWKNEDVDLFNSKLSTILTLNTSAGLIMHILDIFWEELAKVANEDISTKSVAQFTRPFVMYLSKQNDVKLLGYIRNRIFYHLLWQSNTGRDYTEKFNVWKEMGFPTGNINALEKVEESTSENEKESFETNTEKILDPRAGNVDVFIPALPIDVSEIIDYLDKIQYTNVTNTKSRRFIKMILEKYKIYNSGKFPLGIRNIPKPEIVPLESLVVQKVKELNDLENSLFETTRIIKKLNKKKRKKLLSSLNFEELDENVYEKVIKNSIIGKKRKNSTKDEWLEQEVKIPRTQSEKQINEIATNKKLNNIKKLKTNKRSHKTKNENSITTKSTICESYAGSWNESDVVIGINTEQNVKFKKSDLNKTYSDKDNDVSKKENQSKQQKSAWNMPDGKVEYFLPSKKQDLNEINDELSNSLLNIKGLVLNPFVKQKNKEIVLGKSIKTALSHQNISLKDKTKIKTNLKKVKIALQKNTTQKPSDYIKQVRSSPHVPYDAHKKPTKGLLKPNLSPSPINPFYKKKIGLNFN